MCLTVTHVPSSKEAGRVVKCWKMLSKHTGITNYFTPHRGAWVPSDGLLAPKSVYSRSPYLLAQIHGGAIHAYYSKARAKAEHYTHRSLFSDRVIYAERSYAAYALWVLAYDDCLKHLCCKALYVPAMDTDKARRKRRLKLLKNPSVTDAQLRKEFCTPKRTVTRLSKTKALSGA